MAYLHDFFPGVQESSKLGLSAPQRVTHVTCQTWRHRDKQPFKLTFLPKVNLSFHFDLTENLKRTQQKHGEHGENLEDTKEHGENPIET